MEEPLSRRRPSLYAAIRLARMVQQVRSRLQARVLCRTQKNSLRVCEAAHEDNVQQEWSAEASRRRNSRGCPGRGRHSLNMHQKMNFSGLLRELDEQVSSPTLPLSKVAAQDRLFLEHKAATLSFKPIRDASHILDVSTMLLERIQLARTEQLSNASEYKCIDRSECEKYLANLEHLLLCFQQAAFEALVRHSLDRLQNDFQHWHRCLDQQRPMCAEYFSEWSSDRPPLNSTMPWNIKPSLVVLWGVCWMFYTPGDNSVSPEGAARQRRESESAWRQAQWQHQQQGFNAQQQQLYGTLDTTRPTTPGGMHSQSPSARQTPVTQPHGASMNVGLGLHVTDQPLSHTHYQGDNASQGGTYQTPQQPVAVAAAAAAAQYQGGSGHSLGQKQTVPYIRTANITPSSSSDASFAASSPAWNQDQSAYAVGPTHQNVWQPSPSQTSLNTPTSAFSYPQGVTAPVNPHLSGHFDVATSAAATSQHSYARGFTAPQFANQFHFNLPVPMSEHGYPSPHSEASGRESCMIPVNIAETMISPVNRHDTSSYSPENHRDSVSSGSREPPRDQYGQIYCDHHECAASPPTFTRKCEWSKHMDKHLRPYVCLQPGCEKIRGFTYSGGLLRHEREVHRKYGGPKAPRFCPHKDCKRSGGQGFSRKENLHEHLRRVHRGVGIDATESTAPSSATSGPTSGPISGGGGGGGGIIGGGKLPVATPVAPSVPSSFSTPRPQPATSTAATAALPSSSATFPSAAAAGADVPAAGRDSTPTEAAAARKRKRDEGPGLEEGGGGGGGAETDHLREENKRLRHELAEREQRLKMLEDLLLRSMGGAPAPSMMRPAA